MRDDARWRLVAAIAVSVLMAAGSGRAEIEQGPRPPEGLPQQLSSQEFWALSTSLSEPGETFISDNLVSNEMSFAQVVPELNALKSGGVYLGVGPEQNFTFLAAMSARMAFVIDIRRDNLLLHLMYKALFELSPTRAGFLSRLFSRPNLLLTATAAKAADLMDAVDAAPVGTDLELQANLLELRRNLTTTLQLPLSAEDWAVIERAYKSFHEYGPSITYATTQLKRSVGLATYSNLMKQIDRNGQELGFLANEARYQLVRDLQRKNLIVPVVGNFAGQTAVRAVGNFLRARNSTVAAFYLSNVEDYLGRARVPKNGDWATFCRNVATLPLDERSVFVRPLGLAANDKDRRLMVAAGMQVSSRDFEVYPAGTDPELKRALSIIRPELAECGR